MKQVRIDDNNPREYELGSYCSECGIDLLIMPPKKIKEAMDLGQSGDFSKEHLIYEYSGDKYFYCPECQKEHGHDEVEG